MYDMRSIIFCFTSLFFICAGYAKGNPITLHSPDSVFRIRINCDDSISYNLFYRDKEIIKPSHIGLEVQKGEMRKELFSDIEKVKAQLVEKMSKPNLSIIFLEEPEENLYPVTQRDLMNNLMDSINHSHMKHSIVITTHSPYILTSLNNLLYAAEVGKQKQEKKKAAKIIPQKYWVDFDEVGAWFVKKGKITSILDKKEKQIKAEKIDYLSRQLNKKFDKLTNLKYEV